VRTYNDWMIDEWCGGAGRGRLIPMTIVPLWDVELAAAEVRRCADKGSHSVAFTEAPPNLNLPSLYTKYWDPFVQACEVRNLEPPAAGPDDVCPSSDGFAQAVAAARGADQVVLALGENREMSG